MRRHLLTQLARIASVGALVGLIGCGKSPEQQQAEQAQKNAQQMAQIAAQTSNNAQDVAKGFEAMARGIRRDAVHPEGMTEENAMAYALRLGEPARDRKSVV